MHTFQRAILQQLLAKHLDADDKIHFSKRLSSYSESTTRNTYKPSTASAWD